MEPVEGDVVTENVRLVRLLGRGGMGSVWVARHRSLDVDVAVKFVSKELLSGGDPQVVERFRREAKLAAKIESNHVVRIFDHGLTKDDGLPYIVMELMRGESLAERLTRFQRLAPGDAARVISEVANGLSAAHAMGVVHRDIKPHNVFLARARDGTEVAKILDFGIAKTTNAGEEIHQAVKTATGVLIGTPQYMSPEQLMRAGPPDASADLWALAVVAYETVTGKRPFAGETLAATLIAITRAEIQLPSSSLPDAPAGLDGFFARALAVEPSKRFASATELAAAFAEAAGGIVAASIVPSDATTRRAEEPVTNPDLTTAEFLAAERSGTAAGEHAAPLSGPGVEFAATRVDPSRVVGAAGSTELDSGARTPSDDAVPASTSAGAMVAGSSRRPAGDLPTKRSIAPGESQPPLAAPSASKLPWFAAGAIALIGIVAFAVTRQPPAPPPPPTERSLTSALSVTTTATASALPSVIAPAPTVKAISPFKRQAVKEGRIEDAGLWVPDFWVERDASDVGQTFLGAETACRQRKLTLCTNAQFERACAVYPELASDAAWTVTSESLGIVVRGGAAGCGARTVVMPDDVDAARSTLCCTRAVALGGDLKKFGALRNASNQVLLYETRFNLGQGDRVAKDTAGAIGFFNQTLAPDKLAETINWLHKKTFMVHEHCSLALVPQDPDKAWTATCSGLELDLLPESPGAPKGPRLSIGAKQINQRFEFTGSGLLKDIRTWGHPRRVIAPP